MSPAEILAIGNALVSLIKEAPEVFHAIEGVFASVKAKQDPTPAMKHLQAVAEARALGIDPTGL